MTKAWLAGAAALLVAGCASDPYYGSYGYYYERPYYDPPAYYYYDYGYPYYYGPSIGGSIYFNYRDHDHRGGGYRGRR